MHRSFLARLDAIPAGGVWEKLKVTDRQRAIELLAQLAVKRLTEPVTPDDHPVADNHAKERLCYTIKSATKTK